LPSANRSSVIDWSSTSAARRAILVPAPGLGRELERALVREVRFHERDPSQFPRVDSFLDDADAGHQARAVPDRHRDAVLFLQRRDPQAVVQSLRNGFFGIDVLFCPRHLLGERKMLLVRDGEDDPLQLGIGQHRLEVAHRRHAELRMEGGALFL
jgi:hypothetical protein